MFHCWKEKELAVIFDAKNGWDRLKISIHFWAERSVPCVCMCVCVEEDHVRCRWECRSAKSKSETDIYRQTITRWRGGGGGDGKLPGGARCQILMTWTPSMSNMSRSMRKSSHVHSASNIEWNPLWSLFPLNLKSFKYSPLNIEYVADGG